MPTITEYISAGDSLDAFISHLYNRSQSFVAGSNYTLRSIKLKLLRQGSPSGDFVVSVKNAGSDHKPTGSVLSSHAIPSNSLPLITSDWVEFVLDTPINLVSGNRYAIICDCNYDDDVNRAGWRLGLTIPFDGIAGYTNGDGATWIIYDSGYCMLFENYKVDSFAKSQGLIF